MDLFPILTNNRFQYLLAISILYIYHFCVTGNPKTEGMVMIIIS